MRHRISIIAGLVAVAVGLWAAAAPAQAQLAPLDPQTQAAQEALWLAHWGQSASGMTVVALESSEPVDVLDTELRFEAVAFDDGVEVGRGSFVEVEGTRLSAPAERGQTADGVTLEVRWHRVVGTLTGSTGQSDWITGAVLEIAGGGSSVQLLITSQVEADVDQALARAGSLATSLHQTLPVFEPAQLLSAAGPPAANQDEPLPPVFGPGGCDQPSSLDHCGVEFCSDSEEIVFGWLNAGTTCALSVISAILSCGCVAATGGISLPCVVACLASVGGGLASCGEFVVTADQIAELEQVRQDALSCYCQSFPQYQHLCDLTDDVPIAALVEGLIPGESVELTVRCDNANLSRTNTIEVHGGDPGAPFEVLRCDPGWSYHLTASKVTAPGVDEAFRRDCLPAQGFPGQVPAGFQPVIKTFDCTCQNALNCPRLFINADVTGLAQGGLETVVATAAVNGLDFQGFFTQAAASSDGNRPFDKRVFPASEISDISRTSGPERCEINQLVTDLSSYPIGTPVTVAEIDCECDPLTEAGCPGEGEYFVGGTGFFSTFSSVGFPFDGAVSLLLSTGSGTQELDLPLEAGALSFRFPESVADGSSYSVSASSVADVTCRVLNGSGVINGGDVLDVFVSCLHIPNDRCDFAPQLCAVLNPSCTLDILPNRERGIVYTTGGQGEVIGIEITNYVDLMVRVTCTETLFSGGESLTETFGPRVYLRTDLDSAHAGSILLRGVARDDEDGVTGVSVFVDGNPVSLGSFAFNQADPWTCEEVESANCDANSAFSGWLDTTALSDGPHELAISAVNGHSLEVPGLRLYDFIVDNGGGLLSPPDDVAASQGTYSDRVRVTWSAVPGATDYDVWRSQSINSTDGASLAVSGLIGTTWDDTSVTPGLTYFYFVQAGDGTTESVLSAPSGSNGGYAQDGNLGIPTDVIASEGTYTDRVEVSWNSVSGADSYQVWRSETVNQVTAAELVQGGLASPFFADYDADPGVEHCYFVRAAASGQSSGFSGPSNFNCGYLEASPPDPPVQVFASQGSFPNKVLVTWPAVAGVSEYEVWRRPQVNSFAGASRIASDLASLQYSDFSVAPGTFYYYFVKSVEGGEASAPSAPSTTNGGYAQATPPTDPPPPPVTVNATPGAYPDKVFINWSASEGAESYELWRTTGANDPANATRIGQSITATQRFDANVVPGTVYHYFVKAVAAGQAGAFSAPSATNSGYAEAAPVDPPDPPQWVFAGLGTFPDKVYVSWTASEGADHYEVWRRTGTNTSQGAVRVAPNRVARNFTDTNVVPGTFYYYFVKAVRDGDAGPLSPPMGTNGGYAQVLPPPDPPEPPANVYASLGTFSDHVYVFWTSVPEADSYEIWRKQGQNNPTSAQYLGTVSEGTVYNDYAVTGGTTYYYFVKTVNDEGTSGFSQPSPYNGGNVQ